MQQAVVDEQGFQCAFCMPGFVMNMTALVEEQPNATRAEAAQYLSGNLCRCADYNKILNVAERALAPNGTAGPVVGAEGPGVAAWGTWLRLQADRTKAAREGLLDADLVAKVTGRAKYAEDFRAEGMLFTKLLLSPMPHGRVRNLDTSAAMAMPGVEAILTADDLPEVEAPEERMLTNEPLYEGEPILAIAAQTEEQAANAIEAVRIDIEPLPFAVDPLDSLRPGGPNARLEGNAMQGRDLTSTVKWDNVDWSELDRGRRCPWGRGHRRVGGR